MLLAVVNWSLLGPRSSYSRASRFHDFVLLLLLLLFLFHLSFVQLRFCCVCFSFPLNCIALLYFFRIFTIPNCNSEKDAPVCGLLSFRMCSICSVFSFLIQVNQILICLNCHGLATVHSMQLYWVCLLAFVFVFVFLESIFVWFRLYRSSAESFTFGRIRCIYGSWCCLRCFTISSFFCIYFVSLLFSFVSILCSLFHQSFGMCLFIHIFILYMYNGSVERSQMAVLSYYYTYYSLYIIYLIFVAIVVWSSCCRFVFVLSFVVRSHFQVQSTFLNSRWTVSHTVYADSSSFSMKHTIEQWSVTLLTNRDCLLFILISLFLLAFFAWWWWWFKWRSNMEEKMNCRYVTTQKQTS